MKFSKLSQLALVSVFGLLVATVLSGCMIVTIDYVYVAGAAGTSGGSTGQIEPFAADSQTGALRPIHTAVDSGGSKPVSLAASSDYQDLYVANQGNNSIVHFTIASDGSLTKKDSVTAAFTPNAIALSTSGQYLYAVGGSNPGQLAVYSLSSGAIGNLVATVNLTLPGYTSDVIIPTGVNVLPNNGAVFVCAYDQSAYNPGGTVTSAANPGWLYSFSVGSNGALTPAAGSPYQAGVKPSDVASDATNRFVYVTDFASNQLIGYLIRPGEVLNFMVNGPFRTGYEPASVTIDPRAMYIYVANELQNSITGYVIATKTGTPSVTASTTGGAALGTDSQPVSVLVDPALGRFVYTANYLGNSISGFQIDPNTGTVTQTQATPYPTTIANPAAIAAVPHGNHAIQITYP
ncbi:MAG: lactonase family protein [Acidobacteriota bacterium]